MGRVRTYFLDAFNMFDIEVKFDVKGHETGSCFKMKAWSTRVTMMNITPLSQILMILSGGYQITHNQKLL